MADPFANPSAAHTVPPPLDHGDTAETHDAVLKHLEHTVSRVLSPLLPADRPVALLDFPASPNVGDSLIWLGVRAFLAARDIRPCYMCSYTSYARAELARRIEDGTILLSGGGNFGDIYPPHQHLRETVVRDFPGNRIVQLPQTIRFDAPENLERANRIFDQHPDVTLLVRDEQSLALARGHFRAPSVLCPDMALALTPFAVPDEPKHEIVWLARADKEAMHANEVRTPEGVLRIDWPTDEISPLRRFYRRLEVTLRDQPGLHGLLYGPMVLSLDPLARERVLRGRRMLGVGRVVITDRLHGHIFCLLLGIPHVLLDNTNRKVRGFYECWSKGSPLAHWCDDESDALSLAIDLARTGARR